MSCNTFPPGLGVGPSVFPTKSIYSTFQVTNTMVFGMSQVSKVVYYSYSGEVVAEVEIQYTKEGHPTWKGQVLENMIFNPVSAMFEIDTAKQVSLTMNLNAEVLGNIEDQLKKINVYFAIITGQKL